jgi:hypothetical protein
MKELKQGETLELYWSCMGPHLRFGCMGPHLRFSVCSQPPPTPPEFGATRSNRRAMGSHLRLLGTRSYSELGHIFVLRSIKKRRSIRSQAHTFRCDGMVTLPYVIRSRCHTFALRSWA